MATFNCGYGYAGCWNHPDDTTFTFYAKGEAFVIDLGANKKTSQEHNVILVDGEGMDYIAGATMVIGKTEQSSTLEGGELYLRGNNTDSYTKIAKLESSVRHFVYSGGENPFVIACDFAEKAGEHTYSVNFYTKADNTVELSEDGKYAKITGEKQGGICYMIPYSPNGVSLEKTPTFNGISTSSVASSHRQATVFIASEKSAPKVDFSSCDSSITVSVALENTTKTYTFTKDSIISPKAICTRNELPVPTHVLDSIAQEAGQNNA
jgi:hypothetical protein